MLGRYIEEAITVTDNHIIAITPAFSAELKPAVVADQRSIGKRWINRFRSWFDKRSSRIRGATPTNGNNHLPFVLS